jgi:ribosomal protein S18 acetylase RimI-like enzyme
VAVALRPVVSSDAPFLLRVYAGTREEELAPLPWTAEQKGAFVEQQFQAQSAHYAQHYPGMTADIVVVDGEPAGRLLVMRWPHEIRIVDISLLPECRGRSVGTRLLDDLRTEAAAAGKPLSIHVERFNRALLLYQRLGFVLREDKGVYLLLEWRPPSSGSR